MTDQKIDEQLRRLSRAVAETSPEPPELAADSPRTRAVRPVRATSWSFAAALGFGAVTLLAIAWWGPGSDEPEAPVGDAADSRWDWILEHSEATDDETLRIAEPSATPAPAPAFDYAALGTEQILVISDPAVPTLGVADTTLLAPFVYVGTVADTAAGGYLFHSDGGNGPIRSTLEDGTLVPVTCLTISVKPVTHCYPDIEPTANDGLISAVSGVSSSAPQGDVTVSMWLPRETAVAVLNLDDGRSFVQRPVAGVAIFVISDLDSAAVESAEARSASGEVIVHEGFLEQWASLLAEAELSERCQAADHVVATYQPRLGDDVRLENAWMVESTDPSLEAWYFISATVVGGPLDGQIATWEFPAFGGTVDPVNTPHLSIPANEVAAAFDIGTDPVLLDNVHPEAYGFTSWSEVEGFELSQRCVGLSAEVP
ncbi:MAG TPA: hypothetical protein DCY40_07020 [Actinobacteria bacterium]|nr:hypothetical protein [Actinomycetota bacterium]